MKIVYPNLHLIKIAAGASEARKKLHVIADVEHSDVSLSFIPAANNFNEKYSINTNAICCTALMLTAFLLCSRVTYATVTGPGAAWQFVRKITLSAVTPLANFQVKVSLTTAILGNPYSNIKSDGSDLRFYDINNNSCNYWIEGTFINNGTSTVWVNVPTNASTTLFMYYGNAAATAVSNGTNTFDFFDDFTAPPGATWSTITSGGSVTQSGTVVTLSNTNAGSVNLSNTNAFTTSSTSFVLETKHREGAYNRNRFYAATGVFGGNPFGFDNGYFNSNAGAQTTAQVFWNGVFQTATTVTAGTDYLSQWQVTDGSGNPYTWNTYTYPAMTLVKSNTVGNTATPIRFISFSVTEVSGTSTIVDWVRVRKASSSFTELPERAEARLRNISAGITAQTNVFCNGRSTGAATVTGTGGFGGYSYSWNSSPLQTTQTATSLPVGTYTVAVTDNQGFDSYSDSHYFTSAFSHSFSRQSNQYHL